MVIAGHQSAAGVISLVIVALFLLSLASLSAVSSADFATGQAQGRTVRWLKAETCCAGCTYKSSCCCARRDSIPVTVTRFAKTKTVTRRKTITAKSAKVSRDVQVNEAQGSALFARHLCTRCVPGSLGKTNGPSGGPISYCCPQRKTVIKTVKRTTTRTIIRTKTVSPKATIVGRVYYDLDQNNAYASPPDKPIANTIIHLVQYAGKKRAVDPRSLCRTRTDGVGRFSVACSLPASIQEFAVVKDGTFNEPLLLVVAPGSTSTGGTQVQPLNVPVLRPVEPTVAGTSTIAANIATTRGTGIAGRTIQLLCNSAPCGKATVQPDSLFTVRSTRRGSGTWLLSVVQLNEQGAESNAVDAGSVKVLDPPLIVQPAVLEGKNTAKITGKGTSGASVRVYSAGELVGTTIAGAGGDFSFVTRALAPGKYTFNVTQTNTAGESDRVDAGGVVVTVSKPQTPIVVSIALVGGEKAEVKGTAAAGSRVDIFKDAVLIGSTTADAAGAWSFTSASLPVGKHDFEASQTVDGATSDKVSAGSVTITAISTGSASTITAPIQPTTANQADATTVAALSSAAAPSSTKTSSTSETLTSSTRTSSSTTNSCTSTSTAGAGQNWPLGIFGTTRSNAYMYPDRLAKDSSNNLYFTWAENLGTYVLWDGFNVTASPTVEKGVVVSTDNRGKMRWITDIGGGDGNLRVALLEGLMASNDSQYIYVGGVIRATVATGQVKNFTVGNFSFPITGISSPWDAGIFVKLRASNGEVVWADIINSRNQPTEAGIKFLHVDHLDNIYIVGYFDLDLTIGTTTLSGGGNFVAKYNSDMLAQWAVKTFPTSDARTLVFDRVNGVLFVGGWTETSGAVITLSNSTTITGGPVVATENKLGFVLRLDPADGAVMNALFTHMFFDMKILNGFCYGVGRQLITGKSTGDSVVTKIDTGTMTETKTWTFMSTFSFLSGITGDSLGNIFVVGGCRVGAVTASSTTSTTNLTMQCGSATGSTTSFVAGKISSQTDEWEALKCHAGVLQGSWSYFNDVVIDSSNCALYAWGASDNRYVQFDGKNYSSVSPNGNQDPAIAKLNVFNLDFQY